MLADVKMNLEWDFAGAEKHLRRALEINPNCLAAHSRYADLLVSLGRISEALTEVGKIMRLNPISVITCKRIGRSFYRLSSFEEAIRYLDDAVELEPGDYEARAMRGATLIELENYDAALDELNKALELYRDVDVLGTLGYLHALRGEETEAL